ncbi:MAG: DUF1566 domain-containing protein [Patescibacteria group bacterium]
MKKIFSIVSLFIITVLINGNIAYAGNLTPPGSVANTMYNLTDLYNLGAGTTTTLGTGTIETTPVSIAETGKTLTEIYDVISTEIGKLTNGKIAKDISAFGFTGTLYGDIDASKVLTSATYAGTAIAALGDAVAGNVLAGTTFSNATTANISGTMTDNSLHADFTPAVTDVAIPIGFYDGITKISGDADLVEGNIASGVNIFGVAGSAAGPGLSKTGQTTVYQTNDDGTYQKGFAGTRFTDNGNGTITDNATTLMWVKDHNAVGAPFNAIMTWTNAITNCEALSYAGQTDWRLPNLKELQSIADYGRSSPAIDPLFTNTQSVNYWSSTTYATTTTGAWYVHFYGGNVSNSDKASSYYVRCVR